MIRKLTTGLIAGLLVVSVGLGKFSKVATTGANFLKISSGRAVGMGDAFVAIADDASAAYFNPAGLAQVGRSVHANHADWLADMNHDYLAVALPVTNFGTVAFSVAALTMGKMEITQIDNPNTKTREDEGTGLYFNASDFAFGVSYSRMITDKLSFGLTAKGVTQVVWDMSASALGLDLGLFYNTGFKSLRIGATVTNFGTALAFSGRQLDYSLNPLESLPSGLMGSHKTQAVPLPTSFRFGVAYDILSDEVNRLTAAVDVTHPSDINETVNFGLEYGLSDAFFLRAGYILNSDGEYQQSIGQLTGLSAGLGVKVKPDWGPRIGLDYAFRYYTYLKPTHRVMLTLGF
ncbi:MAG: PorV/PorQ family protein [candidate division WOR-3 bacterium]